MDEIMLTVAVALLFLVRVGIPVAILVALGVLLDRWYSRGRISG